MKNSYLLLTLFSLLMAVIPAVADTPFNGMILDGEMKPVRKVKIYVKDPKRYASPDKKGRFGLTDVQPDDTLTLLFGKKEKILVPVDGKRSMMIVIGNDRSVNQAYEDEKFVDSGYGFVKRREHTMPSSGISGERLRRTGARTILEALKGLVPGLEINGTDVTIRGQHSLMLSSTPMYMVDGVQVSSLDYVSIYDVDHVEVMKEASIYGSRGANGAILVTTKTGASKN